MLDGCCHSLTHLQADKEKARASEAKFAYDVGGLAGEKKSLEENINALKERHEAELKTLQEAHAAELTRVAKAQEQSIFEATRSSQLEQEVLEKRLEGLQKLSTTYEHDSTGYASAMTKAQDTAARLEQENRYLIASVQPAVPELLKQYQDFIGNLFESVDQEDLQGIQDLRLQIPKLPSDYELFAGFPSQTSGSRQQPQGRQDLSGAMPGGRRYSAGGTNLPSAEMPGAAATSAAGQRDTARGVKRALGGAKDFTQRAADRANRLLGRTQQPSPSQQVPEDVSGAAPSRVRQRPASEEESRPGTAASDQAAVLRQGKSDRLVTVWCMSSASCRGTRAREKFASGVVVTWPPPWQPLTRFCLRELKS